MVDGEAKKNEREVLRKLEEKIGVLLDNTTYENLADILTFIRDNIETELIVAVKGGNGGLELNPVKTGDGKRFFAMFTSFDEQMKGPSKVQSTYEVSFKSIFDFVMKSNEVDGIMINPFGRAFRMEKQLIEVIVNS